MKRTTRVRSGREAANPRALEDVERLYSAKGEETWRIWRNELLELQAWRKLPKKRVTLKLDADVLSWFREQGRGYQWRINRALRKVMTAEKQAAGDKL